MTSSNKETAKKKNPNGSEHANMQLEREKKINCSLANNNCVNQDMHAYECCHNPAA